jgi:1-acyl-sn-glycerol-3-phosphate acyltransferase
VPTAIRAANAGPLATLIAALRTSAAVVAVSLWVLVVGPPGLVWALLTRRPAILYVLGAAGVRIGFALAGRKLRVLGIEHLPGRAAVFAANHSSNVEPPAIFLALEPVFPRLGIVYKAELRKLPVLVWVWDVAGFVPLERGNPSQSRPAIDAAAKALRGGQSLMIFPEGTRSRTGELLPFKKGGFVMALKAEVPIVPMTVTGARDSMKKGSRVIWPATVTVQVSAPIETAGRAFADRDAVIREVRDAIAQHLPGGRGPAGDSPA